MPWRLFTPSNGPKKVLLLMAVVTTMLAVAGTFIAVYSLVTLVGEQHAGKKRDEDLARNDRQIRKAFLTIRRSRVAAVKLTCTLNRRQNNVLLALIDFSIEQSREKGRQIDPEAIDQTRALLLPITPKATNRICRELLARAHAYPPPPPYK
jgi:hypothetical protein